jgi:nucleotide-binding universal stress UspA family protein
MALPPRTILACTDFSRASDSAVRRASMLARAFDARLILLHVVPLPLWRDAGERLAGMAGWDLPDPARIEQIVRTRLEQEGQALQAKLGAEANVNITVSAARGRVATEIVRLAGEERADLVVAGAHGAHPVRALMVGTTAQKLLRTAPCPVLVVKHAPRFDYKTVLVPTDLSPSALSAARACRALLPGATFHVAHAFEVPFEGKMNYAGVDPAVIERYRIETGQRLHGELTLFIGEAGFAAGEAVPHLRHGYPSLQINEWLRALRADLVVLAAHGKSEIEAFFLGSVSLHVSLTSTCDVLLVRGDDLP